MPFQRDGKRDYRREAEWEKTRKPQRLRDRVMRIQARRLVEKTQGNLPTSQQIDHKKPLTEGGDNSRSNLRVVSARKNLRKEGRRKQRNSR